MWKEEYEKMRNFLERIGKPKKAKVKKEIKEIYARALNTLPDKIHTSKTIEVKIGPGTIYQISLYSMRKNEYLGIMFNQINYPKPANVSTGYYTFFADYNDFFNSLFKRRPIMELNLEQPNKKNFSATAGYLFNKNKIILGIALGYEELGNIFKIPMPLTDYYVCTIKTDKINELNLPEKETLLDLASILKEFCE